VNTARRKHGCNTTAIGQTRVFDQFGRRHREKAGTKNVAIKLYGKRKQQVLEGKKLPELLRRPSVNFGQLLDDALAYSKRNKRSYGTDVPRFGSLKKWFGSHLLRN